MKCGRLVSSRFQQYQFVRTPYLQRINSILRPFIVCWANSMASTHEISPLSSKCNMSAFSTSLSANWNFNSIADPKQWNLLVNIVTIAFFQVCNGIFLMNIWMIILGAQSMKSHRRSMKHLSFVNCSTNGWIVANCLYHEQLTVAYAIHSIR